MMLDIMLALPFYSTEPIDEKAEPDVDKNRLEGHLAEILNCSPLTLQTCLILPFNYRIYTAVRL